MDELNDEDRSGGPARTRRHQHRSSRAGPGFRDAPLMILGEGTNEIQRNIIARQLIQRRPVAS